MFKVLIVVAALTVVSLEAARGVGKKMNGDKDGLNTVRACSACLQHGCIYPCTCCIFHTFQEKLEGTSGASQH